MFPLNEPLFKSGLLKLNVKDYAGALEVFNELIESAPSHWAYSGRAMARRGLGDEQGAMEDMAVSSKMNNECFEQANRGFQRLSSWDLLGGFQDIYAGMSHLNRPITDPLFAGLQKLYVKDYVGALADFDQLIELNPSHWAYIGRSEARRGLGDEQGATEDMRASIKMSSEYNAQVLRGLQRLRSWDLLGGSQDLFRGMLHVWIGK